MKSLVLISILTAIVLPILTSAVYADTLIYNNSNYQGYFAPGYNYDIYDYGTSTGGYVSKIAFGYQNTSSTTSWVRISFYTSYSTTYYDIGYHVKTILVENLPPTGSIYQVYEHILLEEDRFDLPSGKVGYKMAVSSGSTNLAIARGGAGQQDEMWEYRNDIYGWDWYPFWFGGYPSNPWAGLYMKIYTGPPIDEITCDISGYKFDDTDGDGAWDTGETALSGWEIYLDTNGNNQFDPGTDPNIVTDPNGMYFFENLDAPATYTIREVEKNGWTQTLPGGPDYEYTITAEPNNVYDGYDFGNTDQPVTKYGGGNGTAGNPYQIWTAEQMNEIGLNTGDWASHFILMDDISMAGRAYNIIGTEYEEALAFQGIFDGNGRTISNVSYTVFQNNTFRIGLFGSVRGENAEIRNLTLYNPQINANFAGSVGALVGGLYRGTVSNCHVIGGHVSGYYDVGGLVGRNNSHQTSPALGGTVEYCSSSADVEGHYSISNFTNVGGLVGTNGGLIRYSFATGDVTGHISVGGLIGYSGQSFYSPLIYDCYATGTVQGDDQVGGLIGYNNHADIKNCYSTGQVSGDYLVGGLCGENNEHLGYMGDIEDCFWDTETSNQSTSDGGSGRNTLDMQDGSTFLNAGWDFVGETENGTDDVWKICPGGTDYPRLSWETVQCDEVETPLEIILYPSADTFVSSNDPDTNYSAENSLSVGQSNSTGTVYRSFVKFDMSQIPAGCRVVSARLELNANYLPFADVEIGAWTTSENWDESEVTWNNQVSPYNDLPASIWVASMDYNRWDVSETADDRYCYDRELSIMLQSTDETHPYYAGFWSSDLLVQEGPRLIVQYTPIFGGGSGTPDDPYQIWTAEQMNTIGLYDNRWNRSYKLMDDISMAAYTGSAYNQIGRWSTSLPERAGFKGVFDGDGHTISDFQANALFDFVSWGRIQELALIAPVVSDGGALVDRLEYSQVAECRVEGGSVNGGANVGGLIGHVTLSSIGGCSSSATVNGTDDVGGLIGETLPFCQIENCSATGTVTGQDNVGGFIGSAGDTAFTHCYSVGQVNGTTAVGGFCGAVEYFYQDPNIVTGCFWDEISSGQSNSAVGTKSNTSAMVTQSTFTDVGWDFVGETENGRIDDWSMPSGGGYPVLWYQLPMAPPLPSFAGGSGTQAAPYQIATVDQLNSIGRNTRLLDKHFRLVNDLDLAGQPYTMIANGAYAFMGSFDGNSHVIRNISISTPVFYSNVGLFGVLYTGRVSGLTLQNVAIDASLCQNVGSLVGLNRSGRIENCHSQNVDVYGQWPVGGLVGINYWHASISNCSVIGSVAESNILNMLRSGVGGLVGENSWWSTIESSGANATVYGGDMLGGLVGSNAIFAQLTDCYAIGKVTTTDGNAGGLVGWTAGVNMYTRCYAACEISAPPETQRIGAVAGSESSGTYIGCFWDNEINSGLPDFGSTNSSTLLIDTAGETTANMQMAATYQAIGWDFDNVWNMRCEGMNYPRLKSDPMLPGDFVCPEGVEINDLVVLMDEWLAEVLSLTADMAPDGGDGIVNLYDWQRLAGAWYTNPNNPDYDAACDLDPIEAVINEGDLAVFADQWLYRSARYADIAPEGAPDGRVDLLDYALFAENWLTGLD